MSEKRERTAQEILDAIAETEAEYQEIERFAKMSDEDVAKILAEHGVTPEEARGETKKITGEPAPPAKVTPIRRRGFAMAILLAAAFAAAAIGGGVILARNDTNEDTRVGHPPEASSEPDAAATSASDAGVEKEQR